MTERKIPVVLQSLQQVPYLTLKLAEADCAEFRFRGAKGRAHCCELGICMALAFPRRANDLKRMHRASLLLASSERALDFGLQREGAQWLLWKRFEKNALPSPETVQTALDDLLAVMRFLYSRFFVGSPRLSKRELAVMRFA